jgi:hypothetical protein
MRIKRIRGLESTPRTPHEIRNLGPSRAPHWIASRRYAVGGVPIFVCKQKILRRPLRMSRSDLYCNVECTTCLATMQNCRVVERNFEVFEIASKLAMLGRRLPGFCLVAFLHRYATNIYKNASLWGLPEAASPNLGSVPSRWSNSLAPAGASSPARSARVVPMSERTSS